MIKPRQLSPLFLALALGAMGLLAQPAPTETAGSPPAASGAADKSATAQEAPPAPVQTSPAPTTGVDSPFEYRPSEEISEDVSVSFPVDI